VPSTTAAWYPAAIIDCTHADMRSRLAINVPTVTSSGTTNTANSARVITMTAAHRRPPSPRCTRSNTGHVVTTIIVAHTNPPANGRSTQKHATISSRIVSTLSVLRVRSRATPPFCVTYGCRKSVSLVTMN
jgi:hypothetical protein